MTWTGIVIVDRDDLRSGIVMIEDLKMSVEGSGGLSVEEEE